MELNSEYYSIELTLKDIIELIPDVVFNKMEKKILDQFNEKYNKNMTKIDYNDIEEEKCQFGVFN